MLRDLAEISCLLSQNPSLFRYAHLSLMVEIYTVWTRLRSSGLIHTEPALLVRQTKNKNNATPPKSQYTNETSPAMKTDNWRTRTSPGSPAPPPSYWVPAPPKGDNPVVVGPVQDDTENAKVVSFLDEFLNKNLILGSSNATYFQTREENLYT